VRKFLIGLGDGGYPLNPGHEWVGRVAGVGPGVTSWQIGERVYGDTYAGYAEYATLSIAETPWSHGPMRVDDALPPERAVFVEPLADCIHAVAHQGLVGAGDHAVVLGAGQMGLQLVAVAHASGAKVLVVEPLEARRKLALELGADDACPSRAGRARRDWAGGEGGAPSSSRSDARRSSRVCERSHPAVASSSSPDSASATSRPSTSTCALPRAFHRRQRVGRDAPNSRLECCRQAMTCFLSGQLRLERLVTRRCSLDTLVEAFADVENLTHSDRANP
jgi:Zn-dependent alcohol dehydrogenase